MKKIRLVLIGLLFVAASYGQTITETIDMSTAGATETKTFGLNANKAWSVEVTFSGIVGTAGSIDILKGETTPVSIAANYSELPFVLNASSVVLFVEQSFNAAEDIAVEITKGSVTAGTVTITFTSKDRM